MKTINVLFTMMLMVAFTISLNAQTLIQDTDADTRVETERTADDDLIRFRVAGSDSWRMTGKRIEPFGSGNSVFIGLNAGSSDDLTNNSNVFVGNDAGTNTTTGASNVAVGRNALNANIGGSGNFGLGNSALRNHTGGNSNVAIGTNSMVNQTSGASNVGIGGGTNFNNLTGSENVMIGTNAGNGGVAHSKSGNIFIGFRAGYNELGSNLLYIDNSDSPTPLLHGSFDTDALSVNGKVGVNTGFIPGTSGEIFEVNGALPGGRFANIELTDITGASTANDLLQLRVASGCPNLNMIESETADFGITFELDTRGNVDADGVVTSDSTMTAAEGMMVGTTSLPADYLFAVDGKGIMEEVKIQDSGAWPDYVFEADYDLKSLEDVEASINANGHLPGIPSAEEVDAEGGIMVGNMHRLTLEKVEELTLYAIDANKQIKTLNKENDELKTTVEELIKRIEKLEKK